MIQAPSLNTARMSKHVSTPLAALHKEQGVNQMDLGVREYIIGVLKRYQRRPARVWWRLRDLEPVYIWRACWWKPSSCS
jgi:hypothetical protein